MSKPRRHLKVVSDSSPEETVRPIHQKPLPCVVCGVIVKLQLVTSPHPEAPEMMQPPPGAWIGIMSASVTNPNEKVQYNHVFAVCSERCAQKLLEL